MLAQRAAAAPVTIVEFSDPDDDDAGASSRPTPSKGRIPLTAVGLAHSVAPNLTPVYQANKAQLRGERTRRFEPQGAVVTQLQAPPVFPPDGSAS